MIKRFGIPALLLACASVHSSAYADEHYYLQFEVFKYQQKIESGKDFVSENERTWSKGLTRSYLQLSCDKKGSVVERRYSTMPYFAGITVSHQIVGDNLVFKLTWIDVKARLPEIHDLPKTECKELSPQLTSLSKTYTLPAKPTNNQNFPFGKEMNITISLSSYEDAK